MKFRIWDNENNKYYEPVYMAAKGNLEYLSIRPNGCLLMNKNGEMIHESIFPDRFIIEYSTKLLDTNEVVAYEGDIIEYTDARGSKIKSPISLGFGTFELDHVFWNDGTNEWCSIENIGEFEIVGNIHKNKEENKNE